MTQPTFLAWVCAVLKRGFGTWHQHEGWLAFVSYLAIAALALTNFVIDEKLLGERVQNVVSGIAVFWLATNLFVIAPFLLWREQVEQKNTLLDVTDYERVLDELSQLFDHANGEIFNSKTVTEKTLPQWHTQWKKWQETVEQLLEKHFGLRERLMFHNRVLVREHPLSHVSADHLLYRRILADQLEAIRGIILRYSERIEKWRKSHPLSG